MYLAEIFPIISQSIGHLQRVLDLGDVVPEEIASGRRKILESLDCQRRLRSRHVVEDVLSTVVEGVVVAVAGDSNHLADVLGDIVDQAGPDTVPGFLRILVPQKY